jgi:hypothetical protein
LGLLLEYLLDLPSFHSNIVYLQNIFLDFENGDLRPEEFPRLFPDLEMILAGPSSSCAHDYDRLRIPPASLSRTSGAEKRLNGPPPQPSLPAVRQAIVDLIVQPRHQRCPSCGRQIGGKQWRE